MRFMTVTMTPDASFRDARPELERREVRVVIWKSAWLPVSETFIRYQVNSLTRWDAACVGTERVESGIGLESDVILLADTRLGRLEAWILNRLGFSWHFTKYIRTARPDLIHVHFANEAMRVMRMAAVARVPFIVTLHGRDVTEAPNRSGVKGYVYRRRLKEAFRRASRIVAVSAHIANRAVQLGADPSKVVVHNIGVPIRPRMDNSNHPSREGILAVGRLVEKKGFEYLLRAVARLEDAQGIPVTIVGEGPLLYSLEELASSLGLRCQFVGSMRHEDVLSLMRSSAVVCVPSVRSISGDEEGLPTVVMEAGMCETPVVGFTHSGIPEAVQHGKTGLLVSERDADALAAALQEVLADPTMARKMGSAAREWIEEAFDIERQTEKLERIYDVSASALTHVRR